MSDKKDKKTQIGWNEDAFKAWASPRAPDLRQMGLSTSAPNTKSAVALALLQARGQPMSYGQIHDAIVQSGSVQGTIAVETIRVGVSELKSNLKNAAGLDIQITDMRIGGREKFFSLKSASPASATTTNRPLLDLEPPADTAEEIGRNLVAGHVLPSRFHYCVPFTAHRWIADFHRQAQARQYLERGIWQRLAGGRPSAFAELAVSVKQGRRICVLGLGVGEGLGEISLLRELLRETAAEHVVIDYLCVDRSPVLLFSHVEELKDQFEMHLGNRLRVAAVCDNFEDLDRAILRAEQLAKNAGLHDFLPQSAPAVLTLFGNVLGNMPTDECQLLRDLRASIPNRPLALVLGVSTLPEAGPKGGGQDRKEDYPDSAFQFFTSTPRSLLEHHRDVLACSFADEFDLRVDPQDPYRLQHPQPGEMPLIKLDHKPDRQFPDVSGAALRGDLYSFKYVLQGGLTLRRDGVEQTAPAGTEILLYSVVKFDLGSFPAVLNEMGFEVELHGPGEVRVEGQPSRWYGTALAVIE